MTMSTPPRAQAVQNLANFGSVNQYSQSIGLDDAGTALLASLPEEVQNTVMAEFDPRGTKDGNVLRRLFGFARAVWLKRLDMDLTSKQEAGNILRQMSEPAQAQVMSQFDSGGTKDGNILARLSRFAQGVSSRLGAALPGGGGFAAAGHGFANGGGFGGAPPLYGGCGGGCAGWSAAPVAQGAFGGFHGGCGGSHMQHLQQFPSAGGGGALSIVAQLSEFAQRIGLDVQQTMFLRSIPEEVQAVVLQSFDPSGTKDGNVWGRLFGFVRSVWAQRLGLDSATVTYLKRQPDDIQQVVLTRFDPRGTKDGNLAARLEGFVRSVGGVPLSGVAGVGGLGGGGGFGGLAASPGPRFDDARQAQSGGGGGVEDFIQRWNLTPDAGSFVKAMPESVQSVVLMSFRASGTKDGNVWGRLFGFVRSVWSQKLGLDQQVFNQFRSLAEESQINIMISAGDPPSADFVQEKVQEEASMRGVAGGDLGGQFASSMPATESPSIPEDPAITDAAISSFLVRCNLGDPGSQADSFLRGLDPEVRSVVLSEFDPGGTKDGNLFGRLQGFAGAVEGKRRRQRGGCGGGGNSFGAGRNVRPRTF